MDLNQLQAALKRLKRTYLYLRYLLLSKKCWSWPRHSEVLIYDACNQHLLMEYLHPWNPEVLHTRGEIINMRVLLAGLFRRDDKKSDSYTDCYIERVRPKLVVTFIDNNLSFYSIGLKHPQVKTLFIQNGWRGYDENLFEALDRMGPEGLRKLKVDYMLTFGSTVGAKYGHYIGGYVLPIGSLKSNKIPVWPSLQKGVMAFISQWFKGGFTLSGVHYTNEDYLGNVDKVIINCLLDYAKKNRKRLMIIPRNPPGSELRIPEEAYFRAILGHEPEFLELPGSDSSYKAIDAAEVVVSVDSTLGYESIARGNKTAIFSIRSTLLNLVGSQFGWPGEFPSEGKFWTNNFDPIKVEGILHYLFTVDMDQWRKDVAENGYSSLVSYNEGNSILKSILHRELS